MQRTQANSIFQISFLGIDQKKGHKKGQAPHSTQPLRLPLLPSGPHGVHPIVVAWDPTLGCKNITTFNSKQSSICKWIERSQQNLLILPFAHQSYLKE